MQDHTSDDAERRRVVLFVGGVVCTVPAVYHRQGVWDGCLEITGQPFFARAGDSHYGHCGMVLKPTTKGTWSAALDNHGNYWEPNYDTSIEGHPAHIVGWAQEILRQKSEPTGSDDAPPDFRDRGLPGPGTGLGDRW